MNKLILVGLILFLLSGNVMSYTAPTFQNQAIKVESSSDFYGSSNGEVIIDLNLTAINTNFKDFFIRITGLNDTSATIKEISFNKQKIETLSYPISQTSKTKISQKLMNKTPLEITINFNPVEIGIARKFDVQLIDKDGFIIADIDPFLSGWNYRRQMTITAPSDKNIITSQILLFDLNTQDLIINNKLQTGCEDLRVTIGDVNEQPLSISNCNTGNTQVFFKYEKSQLNPTQTDTDWYLYYGNPLSSTYIDANILVNKTNNDYNLVAYYDFNSNTGNILPDLAGGDNNGANTNTSLSPEGLLGNAYYFNNNGYSALTTTGFSTGTTTIAMWIKTNCVGCNDIFYGQGTRNSDGITIENEDADPLHEIYGFVRNTRMYTGYDVSDTNAWNLIILDYNGSGYSTLINDSQFNSATVSGIINPANAKIGTYSTDYFTGFIDEVSIWSRILTPTEKTKLFNSQKGVNFCANIYDFFEVCPLDVITLGDEEVGVINPTFSDFNLFEFDNFTTDLNISIRTDTLAVFDFNVSDDNTLSNPILYYNVNRTPSDQNCFIHIRDSESCGWRVEDPNFTLFDFSGDSNNYRSDPVDDHTWQPFAYNIDPDSVSPAGVYSLDSPLDWIVSLITEAKYSDALDDGNVFFNSSWNMGFSGVSGKNLMYYDCNSQVADPTITPSCFTQTISFNQQKDKDNYINLFYESDAFGYINQTLLNSDGNHWIYLNCPQCNASNSWDINYTATNSNIDRTRNFISTNDLGTLTAYTNTFDNHLHWFDLNEPYTFNWFVGITDSENVDYNSEIISQVIERSNVSPILVDFLYPKATDIVSGTDDINALVFDSEQEAMTCDVNLVDSLLNEYVLATGSTVVNNICSISFNSLAFSDGNYTYHIDLSDGIDTSSFMTDFEFIIDNNAPEITISLPNDSNNNKKYPIDVQFTLTDPSFSDFNIDLNYSVSSSQGTGTQILLNELVSASTEILCVGDFANGSICSYSLDMSAVADGNYFVLIQATVNGKTGFDASAEFQIYSPPKSDVNYIQRYINPNYDQRDSNIYYNPETDYKLTDAEKQNLYLQELTLILIVIGIIASIGVYILWKRKK